MSTRVKCIVCGKRTRHLDGFCNVHRTLNPEQRHMAETEEIPAEADINKEESNMKKFFDITLKVLGVIFVIALLLFGGWLLRGCTATPTTVAITTETTVSPVILPSETTTLVPTETINADDKSALAVTVETNGINQPKDSKFLVHAGDVISGDICIADGTKDILYDNSQSTADVVRFNEDTYVYAEWGCYLVTSCTDEQYNDLVKGKELEGYSVRQISYPNAG